MEAFGPQQWWPADTPFEVMVGAILTQNTSWKNVEKSINRLKEKGVLHPEGMHRLKTQDLASIIRSSGYFRIKADRLKAFIHFMYDEFNGDLVKMKRDSLEGIESKNSWVSKGLVRRRLIASFSMDSKNLFSLSMPIRNGSF